MAFTIEVLFTDFAAFRLFLATGISGPLSLSACAYALRKFCEDASSVMYEPSNLEILMWIGEVNCFCDYKGCLIDALFQCGMFVFHILILSCI